MIKQDTEKLSLPHGRRVGQPGHEIALQHLKSRMEEIGLEPFHDNDFSLPYSALHPADGQIVKFTNLAGVIQGTEKTALPVLIGAHYDSAIDAPCADDNAISVALILSISEILMKRTPRRNVIVAFFDAEEKPYFLTENMGSVRFYNDHCSGINFACVLILDMIGHDFQTGNRLLDTLFPRIGELLFVLGSESHSQLPSIVEKASTETEQLRIITLLNRYIGDRSDHHAFRKAGQPYLFISKGWGRYSHKPEDTVDWINFNRVNRILDLTLNILKQVDLTPIDRERQTVDPADCDIRLMRKAIGWPLPLLLGYMGFRRMSLRSRKDLDTLAKKLSGALQEKLVR